MALRPDAWRAPSFDRLRRAVRREGELDRVPLLELFADREVIANVMGIQSGTPLDKIEQERWIKLLVQFWVELGYDAIRLGSGMGLPSTHYAADDTATLKRAKREWQSESEGPISDWATFEQYAWPTASAADFSAIEFAASILPEGMKLLISPWGMLEPLMWLMGLQPFSFALYDAPDLITAMVERIAAISLPIAETLLQMDAVGGFFTGDDMDCADDRPPSLAAIRISLPQAPG
jgi:hypothetical protein